MSGRAIQKYNKYHQWWSKTEKYMIRLTIVLFLLLYSAQLLNFVMEQRNSRLLTSAVGELEGIAVADSQSQLNMGVLELTVTSYSDSRDMKIYINGKYYKNFDQKSVSLNVKKNDIIEVSGIHSNYPATIKITSVSDNIISPKLNSQVKVDKGFKQIGRIRLK